MAQIYTITLTFRVEDEQLQAIAALDAVVTQLVNELSTTASLLSDGEVGVTLQREGRSTPQIELPLDTPEP